MKSKKYEEDAIRIVNFFLLKNEDRKVTIKHFKDEGLNLRTIQRVLKRYVDTGKVIYSKNSGPKPSVLTNTQLNKIKTHYKRNPNTSVRLTSCKLNIPKSTISDAKKRLNIITRKKICGPKYVKNQKERAEKSLRRLYKISVPSGGGKFFVIDDETYCPVDPSQISGSEYYNVVDDCDISNDAKTKRKSKFHPNYLIWQAISQDGQVSEPYITKGTMNKTIYLEECIKKRLEPFIIKLQQDHDIIFWPDMASSHYSQVVCDYLDQQKIDYVKRNENAPAVPNQRPIERFWALCKKDYKQLNKVCDTIRKFKNVWLKVSRERSRKSCANLFTNFKRNLYNGGHKGL